MGSHPLRGVAGMQQVTLTLTNAVGLHARPAALFVQTAARFRSNITVRNITRGTPAVNAKAILAVLTLGAEHGHVIEISAEGPDEEEAIATLKALVESRFGEDGG
ncbi:MAG TPA: HPr family phosphocarrier protein [Thermoflexus sp.]|nr:HPr family phosphocarrier protein [Thermoflexus sp.]